MLKSIIEKIENKERIDEQEALALYNMDMLQLGELAGAIRTQKYGKKSYFN
ncbi:MAG TPA: aminofutalosine synthase MqnE, partial [Nitratifractor sp.]|nr:aminofutalosine synthase MqnE [Nitratifractor sp.]